MKCHSAAVLPIFVAGGDPRHDELALGALRGFFERIKGCKDWNDMHTRSAWSGAHLNARLGDYRRARRQFKSAWIQLRYNGLPREFVAATVDLCQLICRGVEPWGKAPEVALKLIETCRERADLADDHREGLEEMQKVLEERPEDAFKELVAFRRSFVAPVVGAMAERIGAK